MKAYRPYPEIHLKLFFHLVCKQKEKNNFGTWLYHMFRFMLLKIYAQLRIFNEIMPTLHN